jgi:hypothetical protein
MDVASFARALMAWVVFLAGGHTAFADAPSRAAWRYSAELLRPFWAGTVVEGESVLFIQDEATGEARASVLLPIRKLTAVRDSAGDATYEEGRDYRWNPGSREIVLPPGSRIVSTKPSALRRPPKSQWHELTHRDGDGEILFDGKREYHELQARSRTGTNRVCGPRPCRSSTQRRFHAARKAARPDAAVDRRAGRQHFDRPQHVGVG